MESECGGGVSSMVGVADIQVVRDLDETAEVDAFEVLQEVVKLTGSATTSAAMDAIGKLMPPKEGMTKFAKQAKVKATWCVGQIKNKFN